MADAREFMMRADMAKPEIERRKQGNTVDRLEIMVVRKRPGFFVRTNATNGSFCGTNRGVVVFSDSRAALTTV